MLAEPHAYEDSIDEDDQFMTLLPFWGLIDNIDKNVALKRQPTIETLDLIVNFMRILPLK